MKARTRRAPYIISASFRPIYPDQPKSKALAGLFKIRRPKGASAFTGQEGLSAIYAASCPGARTAFGQR